MSTHTPGPFEIFGDGQITLENGIETDVQVITSKNAYGEDQEIAYVLDVQDAAFIVRACNSHEAMLEALKGIYQCGMSVRAESVIWEEIRAAISKAEGRD